MHPVCEWHAGWCTLAGSDPGLRQRVGGPTISIGSEGDNSPSIGCPNCDGLVILKIWNSEIWCLDEYLTPELF